MRRSESFEDQFERYFRAVYRYALSLSGDEYEAEDLTQHAFYKALEKIDSFEGRSESTTWLCAIVRNEFFDRCRRRKREAPLAPDAEANEAVEPGPEAQVQQKEQTLRLHAYLHALPEPYREVFMLRVFGELRFGSIAAVFGKTESWARVTFYRAKQRLQEKMKEEDDEQYLSL